MGRELQKRKRRSSRPTIRQSNKPKKPLNPMGNSLVARNWNKKETLSQNYRRLGLTAKLGKATGGVEQKPSSLLSRTPTQDPLAVTPSAGNRTAVRSVKVERDPSGRIVKVIQRDNPLNDPLNDLESGEDDDGDDDDDDAAAGEGNGNGAGRGEAVGAGRVVDLLEQEANRPTEKHIRHQSQREREWIARLVEKHGDDTAAMAKDLRLNPMQQTESNIRRRLKTYRENLKN